MDKQNEELVKFNIQMFAEEADNESDDESEDTDQDDLDVADGEVKFDELDDNNLDDADSDDEDEEESDEDVAKLERTKAFSKRLKEKEIKIREEALAEAKAEKDKTAKLRGFDSWEALEKAADKELLESFGVNDPEKFEEVLQGLIEKTPAVIEANKIIKERKDKEQESIVKIELSKINKLNPEIKTLDDLFKVDGYKQMYEKVERGYSLSDAYAIVSLDKIKADSKNISQKELLERLDGKSHIKKSGGGNGKTVFVPQDVMDMYKKNVPKWTDEQVREHYSKNNSESKGDQ